MFHRAPAELYSLGKSIQVCSEVESSLGSWSWRAGEQFEVLDKLRRSVAMRCTALVKARKASCQAVKLSFPVHVAGEPETFSSSAAKGSLPRYSTRNGEQNGREVCHSRRWSPLWQVVLPYFS